MMRQGVGRCAARWADGPRRPRASAWGIAAHSSGPRVRPVTAQQCVAAPDQFGSVVPGRASQYHQYVMSDPTAETRQVDVIAVLRSVGDTVSRVACGDI